MNKDFTVKRINNYLGSFDDGNEKLSAAYATMEYAKDFLRSEAEKMRSENSNAMKYIKTLRTIELLDELVSEIF